MQLLVDGADSTSATTAIGYAGAIVREHSGAVTIEARAAARGVIVTRRLPAARACGRASGTTPSSAASNYIVPGLIAVILMMLSTLLTALTVVRERERGTIEQLIVSPAARRSS